MSTQQDQPKQPAPSEPHSAGELTRRQEELAAQVRDHLAKLHKRETK